jgi:hypothetical protein
MYRNKNIHPLCMTHKASFSEKNTDVCKNENQKIFSPHDDDDFTFCRCKQKAKNPNSDK